MKKKMSILPKLICALILVKYLIAQGNPSDVTTVRYKKYNIKLFDCPDVHNASSQIHCASRASRTNQAYKYVDRVCTRCVLGSNLTFSSEEFNFPRQKIVSLCQLNDQDDLAAKFNLTRTLTPGTLIYLSATLLGDTTILQLERDPYNIVFHMYIRFHYGHIGFNAMINGVWKSELRITSIDPLVKFQRNDVHILVIQDRYVIYLNQVYCCEYMFELPLTDVKVAYVTGYSFVYELSL